MKLRKIAAVLTAAAIAVTSAVVCPISAVAAEAIAELPDGITFSEIGHPVIVQKDNDFILESVPGAVGSTSATINATLLADNGWSNGDIGYNAASGWSQGSYDSTASHSNQNAPFTFIIGEAADYEVTDLSVGSDGSMYLKFVEYANGIIAINKITFSNGYVYYPVSSDYIGYALKDRDFIVENVKGAAGSTSATINATLLADNGWSNGDIGYNAASGWAQGSYDSTASHSNQNAPFTFIIGEAADYEVTDLSVGSDGSMYLKFVEYANGIIAINKITFSNGYVLDAAALEATYYNITVDSNIENGTVTADVTEAEEGDTVTLTVTPDTGYELDALTVKQGTTTVTTGAGASEGEYTFTMPAGDVTISATFAALEKPLTAITLSETTANLLVGGTKTLTVTYEPDDTTDDKTVTWTTSDDKVATVADGKVTAVAAGKATITAKCGTLTATCEVTVTEAAKPCTKVELDKTTAEAEVGKTVKLTATTTPADTTDAVVWTTSDDKVATVANGTVTAVTEGKATITATCGTAPAATCEVTVKAATKPCTKVELDKTTAELEVGKTTALKATTTPADTTDKVVWTTSDDKVATVADGTVTAVAAGKATITATCGAKTATCEVTVKEKTVEPQPSGDAIWEGSHDIGTAWGNALTIDKSRFADVKAGDTLRFTFAVGTAEYHQIQINDGNWVWKDLSCAADADPKYGSIGVKGTTYEFVLTAADAETFKTTGMVLNGYDVILSKVECVGTEGEILKPNGSTTAENENSEEAKKVPAANNTTVAADTAITSENVGSSDAATKTVSQQSAPVSGKYSQRFFMLIDEADVTKYDAVRIRISVTDSNGTVSGVFKTTKYYESIAIGGSEIKAPEGKVFIAFALKNIPDGATVNYSAITLEDRG